MANYSHQGYGYSSRGDGHEDGEISRAQSDKLAEDVFEKSLNALTNADFDKTTKVFGFLEVPTGIVAMFNSAYNVISQFAGVVVRPKAQSLMFKYGDKWLGLKGTQLNHAAALAAIGSDLVVKGGNYFGGVWNAYKERKQAFVKLATSIAPVLDDITGKHTVSALNSVSAEQNEVIYAHRRRIAKITGTKTSNSWIDFAVNTAPNVLMEAGQWHGMWEGKRIKDIQSEAYQKRRAKEMAGEIGEDSPMGLLKHYGKMATNTGTGQVAGYFKKFNDHKLNKAIQPYSALEMILELDKQVANKSSARSFTLPRGTDGRGAQSVPLEEFIARVIVQHQKDMAGLNPEHTEIREALQDDLIAVARPLADAIRKGDMGAMELVRLVGERKIIKSQGRAIASAEEVMAAVKIDVPKPVEKKHEQAEQKEHAVAADSIDPKGLHQAFAHAASSRIMGDKVHQGRANDNGAEHDRGKGQKTFAGQFANHGHAANDHATREHERRATGTDGHGYRAAE